MRTRAIAGLFLSFVAAAPLTARATEVSFERDSRLPLVYLNVAVKAGAAEDPAGKSGLTNFLGEMLLRGTRSKTKEQIDRALDQMGARLEIETRSEALIMRGAVLSSQLRPFLALLTELVTEPTFPDAEIRKLKSEIISGILGELGNDASLGSRRAAEFLFRGHPYGNPVLGKTKEVATFRRDEIQAQYDRLFRDSHLLVVGTGDASQGAIQDWAEALGKARPDTAGSKIAKLEAPANAPSRRLLIVDKPDRTQTQIFIDQIGVRMTDKDFFPLYLGNYAFGGPSFSSRLMLEIRVKRGWSYGAGSSFRFGTQPRYWHAHLFPAAKDTPHALAYSLKMIESLKKSGITAGEFDFSKRSIINNAGFMYNTPMKRVENKLLERTLGLPDGFMKSYGPEISKVTLPRVNSAIRDFFKPNELAITVVCTAKAMKEPLARAVGVTPREVQVLPYTQDF